MALQMTSHACAESIGRRVQGCEALYQEPQTLCIVLTDSSQIICWTPRQTSTSHSFAERRLVQ